MTALKRALTGYVNEVVGGQSTRTDVLRNQLRAIQRRNALYFNAAVAMLVVMFLTAMGIAVSGALQQATIPIASILGISAVGMVKLMLTLWREKVATEMLVELSEL